MTAKTIPRHARTLPRPRRVPRPNAGRLPGPPSPGSARSQLAGGRVRADPLAGPVAITERAVLGDRIRRPTAWCEMPCCISRYEHPAALGQADIHARALAAGWRHDAAGRLVCPCCQQRNPGLCVTDPVIRQDRAPAHDSRHDAGPAPAGRLGGVWTALSARVQALARGQHRRPRWPHPPPRWPAPATAGTRRHPALSAARPAAGTARSRHSRAVPPGSRQPPSHPPGAAGMTTAASSASNTTASNRPAPGLGAACRPPAAPSRSGAAGDRATARTPAHASGLAVSSLWRPARTDGSMSPW